MLPSVSASKPAIARSSVVLPQPEGPSRVKNSLSWMARLTPSSALTVPAPKVLVTPIASTALPLPPSPAANTPSLCPALNGATLPQRVAAEQAPRECKSRAAASPSQRRASADEAELALDQGADPEHAPVLEPPPDDLRPHRQPVA